MARANENGHGGKTPERTVNRTTGQGLSVVVGVKMAISARMDKESFAARLVGVSDGDFLIIRVPVMPGIKDKLAKGVEVVVKYVSEGNVYGFAATSLNFILTPAPLVFVEYPYQIDVIELRQHKRIKCSVPGTVHSAHGVFSVIVTDVSSGGCRVILDDAAKESLAEAATDDMLLVEMVIGRDAPTFYGGLLKAVEPCGKHTELGIMFTGLEDPAKQAINSYLEGFQRVS